MRKLSIAAAVAAVLLPLSSLAQGLKEVQGSFLEPLQQRDSILVADQLRYGFHLKGVTPETGLMLPDFSKGFMRGDSVEIGNGKKLAH